MKYRQTLILILFYSVSLTCGAVENNVETVKSLIKYFLPTQDKLSKKTTVDFRTGDFNGDGIEDIVVVFKPAFKPEQTSQLIMSEPWTYPGVTPGNKYHSSIAIFNGSHSDWISDKTRVFVMLARSGVLETPSFKLIVSKKTDKDYTDYSEMLPVKTSYDLLILPTEAGIDTYVYWDKNTYKFLEPEEMP